ncbi:MAG: MerR family transcriptional regulator [Actinobacteria bacterium]|nr:MerR family transcriptional regulator [Actinomycetota bacterium]
MKALTIGEVLNRLKDEFEDITISKIRYLESEGLINPDRTDSGYRKFTDQDIERLRYVLRAQRDRYLPLKVIKDELDRIDAGLPVDADPAEPDPAEVTALRPEPAPMTEATAAPAAETPPQTVLDAGPTDVSLTLRELCDSSGLEEGDLRQLAEHGLVRREPPYDGDDLAVARAASSLMELGLEARHLRMYRQFAEREVALCEQLVSPLLRQRNPDSRRTAGEQLEQLAQHGRSLHRSLLGRELRGLLRS